MPLTCNLYREDEVVSALQYSILKGRLKESIFWAHEMIHSNMSGELLQTLFWLWMNFFGSAHLSWYTWFHEITANLESVEENDIYLLVVSLGRATVNKRNDSTVFALLLVGLSRVPTDRVGFVVLPPNLRALGVSKTFAIAVKQGKLELAWSLWPNDAWFILKELAKEHSDIVDRLSKEDKSCMWKSEWIWPVRALALTIVGSLSRPVLKEKEEMIAELVDCTQDWAGPMRSARAYSIPDDCLHWFTKRGNMPTTKSTEHELKGGLEQALNGSQFWDDFDRTSSDARENFFDTYFTSDIPDEWSSIDRMKSHGYGVIPPGKNGDIMRSQTFARWFQQIPSKGFWNGIELAITYLTQIPCCESDLSSLINTAYEDLDISKRIEGLDIRPVKRMMLPPST